MPAPPQLITCPKCRAVLGAELFNLPDLQTCPSCHIPVQVEVFPALFREEEAVKPALVTGGGEASCFYHAGKKAVVVCDACGRFLCALCDVDFDGRHICPGCLESGQKKGKLTKLENTRTRHDQIAILIALLPMLIFYVTLITAPAAVVYSIRHWNSPGSVVPHRPKLVFSIAIGLGLLQIAGWSAFFIYFLTRR